MAETKYPLHATKLPEATILADLEGINNDLRLVMDILIKLRALQGDDILAFALFSSALITYRRCFATGVRHSLRREDVVPIGNGASEFHDHLIAQANKLIAHSVNPFERTQVGLLIMDGEVSAVGTLHARLDVFTKDGIEQWGSLVKLLGNTILTQRIEAARQAVLSAAKTLPIAEIIKTQTIAWSAPPPDAASKRRD